MKARLLMSAFVYSFFILPSALGQGALTPPGAPAPTLKSLDQIEPRTPVDATHTPGTLVEGIIQSQFTIGRPGSYYLTNNIVGVSNQLGIAILTNNVALDLNNFSLLANTNAPIAIFVDYVTNVVVRNGTINGWGNEAVESHAWNQVLEHLIVANNSDGIYCGSPGAVVRDCMAMDSAFGGISVYDDATVTGCLIKNAGEDGLFVGGAGGSILNNNCTGCNGEHSSVDVGAIRIDGANNRIEGNHVTATGSGGYGIIIDGLAAATNNLVIRNSVAGSGSSDYSFNSSQIVGPLITNAVSGIITNSNPWANFAF